jgi:prevent-host-death family protein
MVIMAISVTELKARCLELVHEVEAKGKPMLITRRGKVVARLVPAENTGRRPVGARAMLGYAKKFRKARRTADWMKELRAGERG